jgi:TRAP-type mannitol/chloroaromatic compound transport system permease small subunit
MRPARRRGGTLWIIALLVLINGDVAGRNFFNAPIDGVIEIIEITLVAIVFLQLGDATRIGRLTRSDGFFGLMLDRAPRVGYTLGAVFDFLGALFLFFILYGFWPTLVQAWERDEYVGNEGVFTAPTWPVKLIVVVGCVVTLLLFLGMAWRYLRLLGRAGAGERQTP